jgi:hypothetical protein
MVVCQPLESFLEESKCPVIHLHDDGDHPDTIIRANNDSVRLPKRDENERWEENWRSLPRGQELGDEGIEVSRTTCHHESEYFCPYAERQR